MIFRELYKRITIVVTLCLFLMSTGGMILFHHTCKHADKIFVSLYIDATPELCEASYNLCESTLHSHEHVCCSSEDEDTHHHENNGEHEHKSTYTTAKINTVYTSSDQLTLPKPITLSVLSINIPFEATSYIIDKTQFKELPPELPTFLQSGREIITYNHSFKIHC